MSSPLLEHLRAHPEGVLPIEVARGLLALRGPTEVIEIIARTALLSLPGATLRPDGRIRLGEDASPTPTIALVVRSTGPYPPQDFLLEIGLAIIERLEIVAVYSERVLPDRLLPPDAVRAAGVEPASLALASPIDAVLSKLAPLLDGATILTFAARTEFDFLRRILDLEEREETLGDHLPLTPSLRRAGAMPPRGALLTAARTLRVHPPQSPDAGEFARTLGEIYLAALDRGIEFKPPTEREEFDFGKTKFGVDLLKELPERPGVYRFFDRNGQVLYVGKSKNLRARVTGYFGQRAKRRRKHTDLMEQVVDLRIEETGFHEKACHVNTISRCLFSCHLGGCFFFLIYYCWIERTSNHRPDHASIRTLVGPCVGLVQVGVRMSRALTSPSRPLRLSASGKARPRSRP